MAIVNRTPDSFYDRGAAFTDDAAKAAAHRVIEEGADVVDVGGVKAGPGGLVDADEEVARVVPFIEWLRGTYPDQLISVDTWRSVVAKQACAAGADLINDTWAGHDPRYPRSPRNSAPGWCARTPEAPNRGQGHFGSTTGSPNAASSTT